MKSAVNEICISFAKVSSKSSRKTHHIRLFPFRNSNSCVIKLLVVDVAAMSNRLECSHTSNIHYS